MFRHVEVITGPGQKFIFSIKKDSSVGRNEIGFGLPQRKWAILSIGQAIEVNPYKEQDYIGIILMEADYMQKKTYAISYK